jgi:HK97 family phage portal protein
MAEFGGHYDFPAKTLESRSGSPLDNPAIPPTTAAVWEWFTDGNATESGERISHQNAIQITTVQQCVTMIATMIGSMTVRMMERTNAGHIEAIDTNLWYLLAVRPNPYQTAKTYIEQLAGCIAYCGNGYSQIERNDYGQPVALWPINPLKTDIVKVDRKMQELWPELRLQVGELVFKTSDGEPDGQFRLVPYADMIHVPMWALSGVKGMSPVMAARQALGLAAAAEKFGARHFGNSTSVPAVLTNKGPAPTPKVQQEIKESWQRQQGGHKQGSTAFLWGGDWSYQKIGLTPEEAQFLSTRGYQRADIAALWHISPHLVGDTSRLSGTNSEQLMLQFLTITLNPYLGKIQDEFAFKLCPSSGRKANKYFFEFDTDELLRTDIKSQMDSYVLGRQGGWWTVNNILRKLGENPGGPECDVRIVPVNYQNAECLLHTESIQDQPVSYKTEPDPDASPTPDERNMLGKYTRSYISIYSDAFRRYSARSKRDYDAVNALFRPVLRSIADMALGSKEAFPPLQGDAIDSVITDSLKAMSKRSAKWPAEIPADEMATYANAEFLRAVRSIHISVSREIAAAAAVKQLEAPEESEDAETD